MRSTLRAAARAAVHAAALAAALSPLGARAAVTSGVVPVYYRVDFAIDAPHHQLLISSQDKVLRFDTKTRKFLPALTLGGFTMGLDLSPDGRTLAVANSANDGANAWVDLVTLATLATTRVSFPLAAGETGTFSVAFDADGQLLVSSQFDGSGYVPLRRIDPATGQVSTIGTVHQNAMLTATADHRHVAIAESNIGTGPYGRYTTGDASYASAYATGWYGFEIGISPDGSQMAVPTFDGTFINDATNSFANVGSYMHPLPIGVAYAPAGHVVYFPFSSNNYIAAYDTTTMTEISRITVPKAFAWVGNQAYSEGRTKVSSDGTALCSTVVHGIFCTQLTPASPAR